MGRTDLVLSTHARFDHALDLETVLDINDHVQGIVHFEHVMQAFAGRRQNVMGLNFGGSVSFGGVMGDACADKAHHELW